MTKQISVESLRVTTGYLYLLWFCPPDRVYEYYQASEPLRRGLAKNTGLSEIEYFDLAIPEACQRILAYHTPGRKVDDVLSTRFIKAAHIAARSPEDALHFGTIMAVIAELPGRSKKNQRLASERGCQFCKTPCRYGYFVLITEPEFKSLSKLLETETEKEDQGIDAVRILWAFTNEHLWRTLGQPQSYIAASHLGNLAYCLLSIGTSKSRRRFKKAAYQAFQQANQESIQRWPTTSNQLKERQR